MPRCRKQIIGSFKEQVVIQSTLEPIILWTLLSLIAIAWLSVIAGNRTQ